MLIGGATRDPIDRRDRLFVPGLVASAAPVRPVLDPWRTPISVQIGPECVANAAADALELVIVGEPPPQFSRRFIVHEMRRQAGTLTAPFIGGSVRAALSAVRRVGVPLEDLWPHDRSWDEQPSITAYADAETRRGWVYRRCRDAGDVDAAIALSMPVLVSFGVGDVFLRAGAGGGVIGPEWGGAGHAAILCRREGSAYRIRNSWGTSWGERGTALVSEAFVTRCWDMWAIESLGG